MNKKQKSILLLGYYKPKYYIFIVNNGNWKSISKKDIICMKW